mgnify:CR=1 FL=1
MKLEARDISFRYGEGERQVLAHVDLTVESGERVGIMAPSGFGKTTLLKILAGYERPESGEVLLDGTPLERFRGYVPVQMIWQHPELSVNPARRLKMVLAEGDWPEDGGVMRGRIEKEMGILEEWKERYPAEVSGGELQRVLLALALEPIPQILILDEPLSGVDVGGEHLLLDMLDEIRQKYDLSILFSTHDFSTLRHYADKVILLQQAILKVGTPGEVLHSPEFQAVFHLNLGEEGGCAQ